MRLVVKHVIYCLYIYIYIYIILRHTLIIGDYYSNFTSYAISIILLLAY